ncbi:hypothetical protein BC939DRAFT_152190 [Gamsiella multidivaricata]|uniref:uncharacterized protein n=1 Tax=Gamsiella multidivaricata TaxID=101098 RepID=UPI0022203DFC|nr:uncharacterized protein BC939DRAFT_152190 [Gamsiella multidivaricata]KAI7824056.1 hypothetical protein BC939DRAFT_152190 [Gamsiella multidivaricata]
MKNPTKEKPQGENVFWSAENDTCLFSKPFFVFFASVLLFLCWCCTSASSPTHCSFHPFLSPRLPSFCSSSLFPPYPLWEHSSFHTTSLTPQYPILSLVVHGYLPFAPVHTHTHTHTHPTFTHPHGFRLLFAFLLSEVPSSLYLSPPLYSTLGWFFHSCAIACNSSGYQTRSLYFSYLFFPFSLFPPALGDGYLWFRSLMGNQGPEGNSS